MITKRPRGTDDILSDEVNYWLLLENTAREICAEYGYQKCVSVFEHTELFHRGVGFTDIVEKCMIFRIRGAEYYSQEGTAPVVERTLKTTIPASLSSCFIWDPMFRYGRPQAEASYPHQFGQGFWDTRPGTGKE